MDRYVLAIDQGTTGTRVFLFDERGKPAASRYQELRQIFPRPGWVEHDAEEIWAATSSLIARLLGEEHVSPAGVAAVGITNQRETCVVWDRETGKPIHNAIVWQCRRTAEYCERLRSAGHESCFRDRTGLLLDPYFSGTKIRWILDHVAGARARAEAGELRCGTIDSWLIWKLTGGERHATDFTNASRTLLFNIHTRGWDPELCRIMEVPTALLPEVNASAGLFGHTAAGVLPAGIPISGVAGDQQAALFGQGCVRPGLAKNTYGTGAFVLLNTGDEARTSGRGLLTTMACNAEGGPAYALEGAIFIAGAALQWLRDGLEILPDVSASAAIAESLQDNGGVYMVPAFVGLGAPYWDPDARGALLGLTRGTTRGQVIRAALEAMAYQTRDVLDTMSAESGVRLGNLRCDGGATRNRFLMQFQADLLGVSVEIPENPETTAAGAAYLAGLGCGMWKAADLADLIRIAQRYEPTVSGEARDRQYAAWKEAVARVLTRRRGD
ncbi:MAG: glycerol kinase GlpK [Candidatus Schekmanbacteria bacterium]|nr:glycerol kinase GlpK [Candidatus Schekmanbacteria bacterium]